MVVYTDSVYRVWLTRSAARSTECSREEEEGVSECEGGKAGNEDGCGT